MTDDLQIQYKNHHHVNHENHYVYYNETNDDYEQFLGTYLAFDILACGLIISFIKTCYDKVLIGVNERRNRRNDQENLLTSYEHITILCKEDFNSEYVLFKPENFSIILKELNLVDKKSIKKELNDLSKPFKDYLNDSINRQINWDKNAVKIGHKQYLTSLEA